MIARTPANQTSTRRETATLKPGSLASALCLVVMFLCPALAFAQTTSFTYQGRFTDGGTAANGTYDMQFKLFDTASAGSQIGSTITNGAVTVNNGVFTVQLDYGASAFSGADRYLEIGVRPAGDSNPYTVLSPRQQLTAAVYAIRAGSATSADNSTTATNAIQLGGVAASQYVQMNDSRLADARTPTAGSGNYIQNSNSPQAANFNISGNGTAGGSLSANSLNASTDYKIGGTTVLKLSGIDNDENTNTFVGVKAGPVTTPKTTSGNDYDGTENSFFGYAAGLLNTTGAENSFFGVGAGALNTTGRNNTYLGYEAGSGNTKGSFNTFLGTTSGYHNTTGSVNVFIGTSAGYTNESGSELTMMGPSTGVGSPNLTNATAIGARAYVTQSNSLVLGSIKGIQGADEDTNVGIGTTAPKARFHVRVNGGNIVMGDAGCVSGFAGIGFGSSLADCHNYSLLGSGTDTILNRPTGGGIYFRENNVQQMAIAPGGAVTINNLSGGGSTHLCVNGSNQISTCGSSLRYKTNIQPFISGLSVLNRLRPVTFDWKDGGMHDLGFGAEEIAAVEPLLVTHNDKGEVEGVKYDRITAVLVNAVKEQQEQIRQQQNQIAGLKRLVCRRHSRAAVCK